MNPTISIATTAAILASAQTTAAAWSIAEDIVPMLGFLTALIAVLIIPVRPGGAFSRAAKWFFVASIMCYFVSSGVSIIGHYVVVPTEVNDQLMPLIEVLWVPFMLFGVYAMYSQQQISDAIDARHAVVRAGEMLERGMDTTPAGVVVLDGAGAITFANPEARRLLDLDDGPAEDMSGPQWSVAVGDAPADTGDHRSDFSALLRSEPVQNGSVTVSWPNGWRRRLVVNTAPIGADEDASAGAVVAFVEQEPWSPRRTSDSQEPAL
jgi:PAS domain-containing protein